MGSSLETERYVPVSVVTEVYGKSRTHVYKLASEEGWRRIRMGREVRYHVADIAETFGDPARRL